MLRIVDTCGFALGSFARHAFFDELISHCFVLFGQFFLLEVDVAYFLHAGHDGAIAEDYVWLTSNSAQYMIIKEPEQPKTNSVQSSHSSDWDRWLVEKLNDRYRPRDSGTPLAFRPRPDLCRERFPVS